MNKKLPKQDHYCKPCGRVLVMSSQGFAKHKFGHELRLKRSMAPSPTPPTTPTTTTTETTDVFTAPTQTPSNPLACPECAAKGIEKILGSIAGRNNHRSRSHGVVSANHKYYVASLKKQKQRKEREGSAIVHAKEIHSNGNNSHSKSFIPGQEATALFAAGYVKGRLDGFAESSDVAPSVFTQGICQLLLDSSGGQTMGPQVRVPGVRRSSP